MSVTKKQLEELKRPLSYKWRVQSQNAYNATCVAYIDSRIVQDVLDDCVSGENWQDEYILIDGKLFCRLGIKFTDKNDNSEWVWKTDCGTESNTEKEKGQASDAFKRSAVKWGVGRFLYSMGLQTVKVKKYENNGKMYPCNDSGNILWDGNALTEFITKRLASSEKVSPPVGGVNLRNEAAEARAARYNDAPTDAQKSYTSDTNWSPDLVNEIKKLVRGKKSGSTVLKDFIPAYNDANNTQHTKISDFKTDAELSVLLELVRSTPPSELDV